MAQLKSSANLNPAPASTLGRRVSLLLTLVAGAALILAAVALASIIRGAEDSYPHEHLRSFLGPLSTFFLCAAMFVRIRLQRLRFALPAWRLLLGATFAIVLYSFWLAVNRL